jgi:hypothetical protein
MVIDNFTLLEPHMIFHESLFYFIQIIKRRKDKGNENMSRSERLIKSYFIDKPLSDETQNEIKMIAKIFNARVYINLAPCSKEKAIKLIASKMFSKVLEQQFDNFTGVINSVAGDPITAYEKLFLVDVDTKDEETINQITDFINCINPVEIKDKIVVKVPTVNGVHLICQPFNTKVFKDNYPGIDIHKHNPTLLYCDLK